MKYLVMECHPGYAVVLDETGQFRKVANMRFEVGQTLTAVTELSLPQAAPARKRPPRWLTSLTAVAACLALLLTSVFYGGQRAYASVYMTINPQVRIDVNRSDLVVGLEGVNEDGKILIDGYSYQKKDLDLVVDELVDRAIEMDFLHEGDKIALELDAQDNEWVVNHRDALGTQLDGYLTNKIAVTIEVTGNDSGQVIIPVEDDDWDDADDADEPDDDPDDEDEPEDDDDDPDDRDEPDDDDSDDRDEPEDNDDDPDDRDKPDDDSDDREKSDAPERDEPDDDDDRERSEEDHEEDDKSDDDRDDDDDREESDDDDDRDDDKEEKKSGKKKDSDDEDNDDEEDDEEDDD